MHPHWRFPNITLLALSLVLTAFILASGRLEYAANSLGELGYLGVFVAGLLFVSTFTIAPAAAVLFEFGKSLDPLLVSIIGGSGAAIGDYLAYLFIRDRLLSELNPILKMLHLYRKVNILHSKYFAWLAPVVGAAIIASPLPDEIGLSLLGLKRMKPAIFLTVVFALNTFGIFIIVLAAKT